MCDVKSWRREKNKYKKESWNIVSSVGVRVLFCFVLHPRVVSYGVSGNKQFVWGLVKDN